MELTRYIAELATETRPDALSPEAYAAARKMVLDTLGCALAGRSAPGVAEVVTVCRARGGVPQAQLLVWDHAAPMAEAALANSVMIHALDYDDVHLPGSLHIMSVVFPAALAAAQATAASGRDLLTAVTLGVEAAGRIGRAFCARRRGIPAAGWLPTSVVGAFGAAAAASRLLNLSTDQAVHALGMTYAQAAGNRQALYDASLTKRLQPGFAARTAIQAVELAAANVTGPVQPLEGDVGLFRLYLGAEPPGLAELAAPRPLFEIEYDCVKPFPTCGASHALTQAALDLASEHDLPAERIERAELYWGPRGNELVGRAMELGEHPQVNAQFSAPYCVALALRRGSNSLDRFTDAAIRADRETLDLATRVHVVLDMSPPPEARPCPEGWPAFAAEPHVLRIGLTDGTVLRRERNMLDVMGPAACDWDAAGAKFHACAAFAGLPRPRADAIHAAVATLEDAPSLQPLLSLFACG